MVWGQSPEISDMLKNKIFIILFIKIKNVGPDVLNVRTAGEPTLSILLRKFKAKMPFLGLQLFPDLEDSTRLKRVSTIKVSSGAVLWYPYGDSNSDLQIESLIS